MQFSDHKKQIVVGKYPIEYKELVNAYLHESQARVDNLCRSFRGKEPHLGILVALAQDFAATHKFLEETKLSTPLKEMVVNKTEIFETETDEEENFSDPVGRLGRL